MLLACLLLSSARSRNERFESREATVHVGRLRGLRGSGCQELGAESSRTRKRKRWRSCARLSNDAPTILAPTSNSPARSTTRVAKPRPSPRTGERRLSGFPEATCRGCMSSSAARCATSANSTKQWSSCKRVARVFRTTRRIRAFHALALLSAGRCPESVVSLLEVIVAHADAIGLDGYERALRAYTEELRSEPAENR